MNLTCNLTRMITTLDLACPGVTLRGWCDGRVNCSWEAYQVCRRRLAIAQMGLRQGSPARSASGGSGSLGGHRLAPGRGIDVRIMVPNPGNPYVVRVPEIAGPTPRLGARLLVRRRTTRGRVPAVRKPRPQRQASAR